MKISALQIDGFGAWSGLKLDRFDAGLNVFYGPNEAGKTTLLQFIRSVFYGFSPERRPYFPPVHGGRPGGSIEVAGPNGQFEISRHDEPSAGARGELILQAADGTRQGEHLLKVLLCDVDEAIFNNVFAVGLHELQELATLSGTEAAELLYRITAGLDRVSLVEVLRELHTSRNRILSSSGDTCQVVQLLAEREKLRAEIEDLGQQTRRYGRLAAERNQLQREITRLEEDHTEIEYQARAVEISLAVRDRWRQRAALDEQLQSLGPAAEIPEMAAKRLDAIQAALGKHQQRAEQLGQREKQLRQEAAGLPIHEALRRQAARIEALAEQQSWLRSLQEQVAELQKEVATLQSELKTQCAQIGVGPDVKLGAVQKATSRVLLALRPAARGLRQSAGSARQSDERAAAARQAAQTLAGQIEAALGARGERDLAAALDRVGGEVAQYRRRLQIDERLAEMSRSQTELEQQSHGLLDRQLLPAWVLLGLGGLLMCGVILVVLSLFLPATIAGPIGWALAGLGLLGIASAGFIKFMLDRSNAQQLDACQKQTGMLQAQVRQIQEEREGLDCQIPRGSGSLASRLEKAEKQLATLEELVPLDARRQAALQEAEMAERSAAQAKSDLAALRRRWREALVAARLPEKLSPHEVRHYLDSAERIGQLQGRLQQRQEELQERQTQCAALVGRIAQVAADAGLKMPSEQPLEQLQYLSQAVAEQDARVKRREAIRRQRRHVRRRQTRHAEAIARLKGSRRDLLRRANVASEEEFRQLALHHDRAELLKKDRDTLNREIAAAIAGHCPEQAVAQYLQADAAGRLETLGDDFRLAEALGQKLREHFEKCGQLAEQMKGLAEDRRIASLQLDLGAIEKRLEDAICRWQVLAVTSGILDSLRTTYERERQPETLQEASGYLERLTRGRYRRVWTPLGEPVLRVDDAEGASRGVELLSRGTREQLFLALRLALAASYARRGAALPIVLDDVLVNFDSDRAKAAAAVLRDFAQSGHQILVFTCHEHILKLFKSLHVCASSLPGRGEAELPAPTAASRGRKRGRRPAEPEETPARITARQNGRPAAPPIPIVAEEELEEEAVELEDAPWAEEEEQLSDVAPESDNEEDLFEEDEEEQGELDEYEWEEAPGDDDEPTLHTAGGEDAA